MNRTDYLAIADDGTIVRGASVEGGGVPVVQFGDDAPIPVPAHVRNLVCQRSGLGAAFKGQDGRCYFVHRGGGWAEVGMVYGDEAVAFTPDGRLVFVTSPTHYVFDGDVRPLPAHRAGTSQGLLDAFDDGTIRWTDDCFTMPRAERTLGPIEFVKWRTRGLWTFGSSQQGVAVWNAVTQTAYVLPAANTTAWTVQGAMVGRSIVLVSSLPAHVFREADFTRYVAPTPTPDPPPDPTPQEPTVPEPTSLLPLLQSARLTFPTPMTQAQCVELLNRVAFTAGHGWGLLRKESGNHGVRSDGTRCSVDWLVHLPSGTGVDCLSDAEGAGEPTWGPLEPFDVSRWVAPIGASVPTPEPPPVPTPTPTPIPAPTVDLTPVLAAIGHLAGRLEGIEQALRIAVDRLDVIEQAVPDRYRGQVKAGWLGTFEVTLTPEKDAPQ